jgi:hypothetical protein
MINVHNNRLLYLIDIGGVIPGDIHVVDNKIHPGFYGSGGAICLGPVIRRHIPSLVHSVHVPIAVD